MALACCRTCGAVYEADLNGIIGFGHSPDEDHKFAKNITVTNTVYEQSCKVCGGDVFIDEYSQQNSPTKSSSISRIYADSGIVSLVREIESCGLTKAQAKKFVRKVNKTKDLEALVESTKSINPKLAEISKREASKSDSRKRLEVIAFVATMLVGLPPSLLATAHLGEFMGLWHRAKPQIEGQALGQDASPPKISSEKSEGRAKKDRKGNPTKSRKQKSILSDV